MLFLPIFILGFGLLRRALSDQENRSKELALDIWIIVGSLVFYGLFGLSGKGIQPVMQNLKILPDQNECALEIFPMETNAYIELKTSIRKPIQINLSGLWEPFRGKLSIHPFRQYTLTWKTAGGAEETIRIPEQDPGSVLRLELKGTHSETHPADPEIKEALALIKDSK